MTLWIVKFSDSISMLFVDSKLLDFSTAAASCVLKVELQAVLANVANVKYLDARWD